MDLGCLKPLSSCRLPVVRYREGVGSKHDMEMENGARTKAVVLSMTLSPLNHVEARRFGAHVDNDGGQYYRDASS